MIHTSYHVASPNTQTQLIPAAMAALPVTHPAAVTGLTNAMHAHNMVAALACIRRMLPRNRSTAPIRRRPLSIAARAFNARTRPKAICSCHQPHPPYHTISMGCTPHKHRHRAPFAASRLAPWTHLQPNLANQHPIHCSASNSPLPGATGGPRSLATAPLRTAGRPSSSLTPPQRAAAAVAPPSTASGAPSL